MADRLTGMQVFSRVAALGSLSAAAREMKISQTMAGKHIAELESRLGVQLMHRTTRRISLTELGRTYLDAVEHVLAEVDEADRMLLSAATDVRGTLRVSAPYSFGAREVAPLLPEFSALHPMLNVELGISDRRVNPIDEGWDMAILIGNLPDSSMLARKLAPCNTVICASPAYLERYGRPAKVADLSEHNCLGFTLSVVQSDHHWRFGRKGDIEVAVRGSVKANTGDVLLAAVLGGLGISYLPTYLAARPIADGALVPLVLDHPTIEFGNIFALYPADRRPPAKVRAFVEFLISHFGAVPHWDRTLHAHLPAASIR
jgi:DNA-binding transcriptional LysR family regulator